MCVFFLCDVLFITFHFPFLYLLSEVVKELKTMNACSERETFLLSKEFIFFLLPELA